MSFVRGGEGVTKRTLLGAFLSPTLVTPIGGLASLVVMDHPAVLRASNTSARGLRTNFNLQLDRYIADTQAVFRFGCSAIAMVYFSHVADGIAPGEPRC